MEHGNEYMALTRDCQHSLRGAPESHVVSVVADHENSSNPPKANRKLWQQIKQKSGGNIGVSSLNNGRRLVTDSWRDGRNAQSTVPVCIQPTIEFTDEAFTERWFPEEKGAMVRFGFPTKVLLVVNWLGHRKTIPCSFSKSVLRSWTCTWAILHTRPTA